MPHVTSLRLNGFLGYEDLSNIASLFPNLRTVTLAPSRERAEVPESALAAFPVTPAIHTGFTVV